MRFAGILTRSLVLVASVCTVGWLSPLAAQELPQTINLTFTTIDVPGANYTVPWGINTAGDIVGNYGQNSITDSHGFKYSAGTFTYFDYPGEAITVPTGINDSGLIVGYAGSGDIFSFLYDGVSFTTFTDGSNSATESFGINNAGEIVGGAGTIGTTKGFAMLGGRFKTLNVTGDNVYVQAIKVNNLGTIVGTDDEDGFLCRGSRCQSLDFPGATHTAGLGINDDGLIVGWYSSTACLECGFVRKNGKYFSFTYPGAAGTTAGAINAAGQIVGQYTFDFVVWHGYVTNPITEADFPGD